MRTSKNTLVDALARTHNGFVAAGILSVFINLSLLALPIYSMQVFDRVLSSRSFETLLMLSAICIFFILVYGLLEVARAGILQRVGAASKDGLSDRLLEVSVKCQIAGDAKTARQCLQDGDILKESITGPLLPTFFDAPWSIVFITFCFFLHPYLGWVAFFGAAVLLVCAIVNERVTTKVQTAAAQSTLQSRSQSTELLQGGESWRALGMMPTLTRLWKANTRSELLNHSIAAERNSYSIALTKVIRMMLQVAVLAVGTTLAIEQEISGGAMITAMMLVARALAPIESAVANWKRFQTARVAFKRLEKLFALVPADEREISMPTPHGHLTAHKVTVVPPGGKRPVVRSVSFDVAPGELLAIVGASGSGKSSLAKTLAGAWAATGGEVRIDGVVAKDRLHQQTSTSIGYLSQDLVFLSGTVAQNISRFSAANDEDIIKAAIAANVHDAILALPDGYETQIGEGGLALCGGLKQRIALARAIFGGSKVLILDEPNSNLDTTGDVALFRALKTLKQNGRSIVVVTHRPQLLQLADNVLVMENGHQVAFGAPCDIIRPPAGTKSVESLRNDAANRNALDDQSHSQSEQHLVAAGQGA